MSEQKNWFDEHIIIDFGNSQKNKKVAEEFKEKLKEELKKEHEMSEQRNEFSGFVDGEHIECVISYDDSRDLYECIVAHDGKIDNKFYSIKRSAMETIAKGINKMEGMT